MAWSKLNNDVTDMLRGKIYVQCHLWIILVSKHRYVVRRGELSMNSRLLTAESHG